MGLPRPSGAGPEHPGGLGSARAWGTALSAGWAAAPPPPPPPPPDSEPLPRAEVHPQRPGRGALYPRFLSLSRSSGFPPVHGGQSTGWGCTASPAPTGQTGSIRPPTDRPSAPPPSRLGAPLPQNPPPPSQAPTAALRCLASPAHHPTIDPQIIRSFRYSKQPQREDEDRAPSM